MATSEAVAASRPPTVLSPEDAGVLAALRSGDESAFAGLVAAYGPAMLRLARTIVPPAVAEEVVQDAWLGVIHGLDRFEGRASLKTWIFRILTNTAKTRAVRERRSIPFSALAAADDDEPPAVDPSRFLPDGRYTDHWRVPPSAWPEERLAAAETRDLIAGAIEALPPAQRAVISLRDVEGWDSTEVCEALGLSEGNQRVLLHRARSRVRAALERHFAAG